MKTIDGYEYDINEIVVAFEHCSTSLFIFESSLNTPYSVSWKDEEIASVLFVYREFLEFWTDRLNENLGKSND